ncbi:MAG: acyl-CoA ligase (AMP-forming), exosortase A system-associated [Cellvibrionaceae bacterium]|nr:acyl-CoA ligase (AMP-forming), exosortase A system-associated [Cellvibrionaceae bacterium]|tara:strand:+ start:2696 stop:4381 length:1686 start_codon:yes stop_codon:yes gene_type:complete
MLSLVHQLVQHQAGIRPDDDALRIKDEALTYQQLWQQIQAAAIGLAQLGLNRGDRVATYLPKTFESVITLFATSAAGCVFVPINPLLKPAQVQHILQDCDVACLITSADRTTQLAEVLSNTAPNPFVIIADNKKPQKAHPNTRLWSDLCAAIENPLDRFNRQTSITDEDVAAILYTSGSTGKPKGVVLCHRNLLSGAESVASYLQNTADDRLLAVLPFSFDYGLSQLTTAFYRGACVVLMDYLLPHDVIRAVVRYEITGLAAVPPLWNQLADLEWPEQAQHSLRYITNSGGAVPPALSDKLHHALPHTDIYLMYGLTEAFRSTYLPPEQLAVRPTSIGKAIPNAEVLVLRADGSVCDDNEAGELVHRGPLVAQGYWNAPEKTAKRFKPFYPDGADNSAPEIAVWSGDRVYRDPDGYLYFVSRTDEMIKTSGYRVSPAEVEDVLYQSARVKDAVALGLPHEALGQAIAAVVTLSSSYSSPSLEKTAALMVDENNEKWIENTKIEIKRHCQQQLPNYMIPATVIIVDELPKNPNGKYDRTNLHQKYIETFSGNRIDSNGHQQT